MFHNVYLKSLYTLRWQLLGWTCGIGFVVFLTVIFYDSLKISGFGDLTKSVPAQLQSLVGSLEDFTSINGYVGQFVFGSKTSMLLIPMALILFISQGVSEEADGRLGTLLTLPISRTSVYLQKWFATATVLAIIILGMVGITLLSVSLLHHTLDMMRLAASAGTCFLMCLTYGTLAFALGMATGRKALSITFASAYAGISLILSSIAPTVSQLKEVDRLSILHYYNIPNIMLHGLNLTHTVILAAITLGLLLFGWFCFRRRSLQLP